MFCFENLGFVLLLGLMLFWYPKSSHQHFCSIQDRFPSIDIDRCHWWVCWPDASGENPPLAFFVLCKDSEHFKMHNFFGYNVPAGQMCFLFPPLPSPLTPRWGCRFALFSLVNKLKRCGLLCSLVFLISMTPVVAAGLLEHAQSGITAVIRCSDCKKVTSLLKSWTGLWVFLNGWSTNDSLVAEVAACRK